MPRATETDVAIAILKIANSKANGICTFDQARNEVGRYIPLSASDIAISSTRPGEPMWHQQIRNIQSHHNADGNFINDGLLIHVPEVGYKITPNGKSYLNKLT